MYKPIIKNRDAKKRYVDCLLNLMASTTKMVPAKKNMAATKTDILETPAAELKRLITPINMREKPIIKTAQAAMRRECEYIYT